MAKTEEKPNDQIGPDPDVIARVRKLQKEIGDAQRRGDDPQKLIDECEKLMEDEGAYEDVPFAEIASEFPPLSDPEGVPDGEAP